MVGNLVTHNTHDVVSVCDETDTDRQSNDSNLPKRDRSPRSDCCASRPSRVHSSPHTDGVTNIVGSVCERCGTGCDDLDERVEVFDLVLVLGSMCVNTVHTATFWSSEDTELSLVDVVVETVHTSNDNHCRKTVGKGLQVVQFVDRSCTWWVVVEPAHGPSKRSLVLSQLGVVLGTGGGQLHLVVGLSLLRRWCRTLDREASVWVWLRSDGWTAVWLDAVSGRDATCEASLGLSGVFIALTLALLGFGWAHDLATVLEDSVIWHLGLVRIWWSWSPEEHWSLEDVVQLKSVVLLHDLAVSVWDEEESCKQSKCETCSKCNTSDPAVQKSAQYTHTTVVCTY